MDILGLARLIIRDLVSPVCLVDRDITLHITSKISDCMQK